jgi:ferritin
MSTLVAGTLTRALTDAINDQIQWELSSGYLYLAMEAHLRSLRLPGGAHWMRKQAEEELGHAMRFVDYVAGRGGRVRLQAIGQPPADFGSPEEVFEQALAHEQTVSRRIDALVELARREGDGDAGELLQWYVDEQVEEEESAGKVVSLFRAAGEDERAIAEVDRRLASRAR